MLQWGSGKLIGRQIIFYVSQTVLLPHLCEQNTGLCKMECFAEWCPVDWVFIEFFVNFRVYLQFYLDKDFSRKASNCKFKPSAIETARQRINRSCLYSDIDRWSRYMFCASFCWQSIDSSFCHLNFSFIPSVSPSELAWINNLENFVSLNKSVESGLHMKFIWNHIIITTNIDGVVNRDDAVRLGGWQPWIFAQPLLHYISKT